MKERPLYAALRRFAQTVLPGAECRFGSNRFRVTVDWEGLNRKVRAVTPKSGPVIGGLISRAALPSFANRGEQSDILVVNLRISRISFFTWLSKDRPAELRRRVAEILAHEARHIEQGMTDYGLMNWILPGAVFAWIAVPIALALALSAILSWDVAGWIMGYCAVSLVCYLFHPKEVDANRYARERWEEWAPLVRVERIE